jgi:hypothetical protein
MGHEVMVIIITVYSRAANTEQNEKMKCGKQSVHLAYSLGHRLYKHASLSGKVNRLFSRWRPN